jgi:hypothetical protein
MKSAPVQVPILSEIERKLATLAEQLGVELD